MPSHAVHAGGRLRLLRLAALTIGVLVAWSIWAAQAYAQTPDGPAAVDQYVEDVPTSGGSAIPGSTKHPPKKSSLPHRVSSQIASQGGSDAAILRDIASSPDYGAPAASSTPGGRGKASGKGGTRQNGRMETDDRTAMTRSAREGAESIPTPSDSSDSDALSAAVSAVQGGDAARLVGLLVVLFAISVAALAAAGLRNRRRGGAR